MRLVCQEKQCAGCMACVDSCPVNAIAVVDYVNYYNAEIDENKCIHCNLCHRICQKNNVPEKKDPIYWAQGWSNDTCVRNRSSSGGFAYEIMKAFLKIGGCVCSCRFDNGAFTFAFTEKEDEIKLFSGSKYVKSNPKGIYRAIKEKLKNGEKVLFLGLPCQVASLINCVGVNSDLYTVDLICHGTPSPKVLEAFLNSNNVELRNVNNISFRSDGRGYSVSTDGSFFSVPGIRDYYSLLFMQCSIFTDNCYNCEYASTKRISDITIGDAWGSELPAEMRRGGVSLALCQTEKGKELLELSNVTRLDIDLKLAQDNNPQLVEPASRSLKSDELLEGVNNGAEYNKLIRRIYPDRYYKDLAKKILKKMKLL